MAFSQNQLDALEEAIAKGVTRVQYEDKEIVYRSLDEMMRLRDKMLRELGQKSKTTKYFAKYCDGIY
jgi:thiamine monophosphate synthase